MCPFPQHTSPEVAQSYFRNLVQLTISIPSHKSRGIRYWITRFVLFNKIYFSELLIFLTCWGIAEPTFCAPSEAFMVIGWAILLLLIDIQSAEVLEEVLETFNGTLFVISHDRYFLDKVVDRVVALDPDSGVLNGYDGGYTDYLTTQWAIILEMDIDLTFIRP